MKKSTLTAIFILITVVLSAQSVSVVDLKCEHKKNPIGVESKHPRLSWKLSSNANNVVQTAYQIRVSTTPSFSSSSIIWNSDKTISDQSVLVPYDGSNLKSGQRYYWQVRVWDNKKNTSKWSETAYWEMGILNKNEWIAKWIEIDDDSPRLSPAHYMRKEFEISKKIAKATIYATAHGIYDLSLNGSKVGDQVFTPGWTTYGKRLQYQVYDVTNQLNRGANAIGAVIGEGWYKGSLGWTENWGVYGKHEGLLMQMEIIYSDGSKETIISDGSWKATKEGPITKNGLYYGEDYDATKELIGWNKPKYDDKSWRPVTETSYDFNLIASEGADIKKIEELKPVKIFTSPSGKQLVDLGQNLVGRIRLKTIGEKGTKITIRHAEVLDKDGEFYTENLRSADCVINYTLSGEGEEIYEPTFTFMGFRYVEITGYPGKLTEDDITAVVIHSDMQPTGKYETSDPLLNQLQHNIVWGQKGNFLDVPTDCPQRDERMGWTGDAQAFVRTASFNYDVAAFFTKWLKDLSADQRSGGEVPFVIPDVLNPQNSETTTTSAGWGDVATIAPWTIYQVYGDKDILEAQYPSMKAYVEYIRNKAGESMIWKSGSVFGDWLFYHPFVNDHGGADGHTDKDFIATAFYAYSTSILADVAKVLGKTEDASFYEDLFENIKSVFIHEYITPAGRIGTNSQTSYVLALMFNLVPENVRAKSAQLLVDDIRSRGTHLSTGFLGTPYLCHVLSDNGFTDVAYDLLMQKTFPSWLYPVTAGATTIWERWDGQRPDGTFQDAGMNSFNHYAYGAIGDWMYQVSAGLDVLEPGYKHLLIKPHPTHLLEYSKASFDSPYGVAESGWERRSDGKIIVNVVVPANATATVELLVNNPEDVTKNDKKIKEDKSISNIRYEDNKVKFNVGSGIYTFEYDE